MSTTTLVIVAMPALVLARVNGANDVSKGVATLIGSGLASARRAILWGTLWTVLGGLAALAWGSALIGTFANGFLTPQFQMSLGFSASAATGALAWLLFATLMGWPVSTTHALLGGIVGATLAVAGPEGLRMSVVTHKALLPLLLSPLLAIALCWLMLLGTRWVSRRIPAWQPGCCPQAQWRNDPFACAIDAHPTPPLKRKLLTILHWVSGGATRFARGLNDVPKIAALLIIAVSATLNTDSTNTAMAAIVAVTLIMGLGSVWGGMRVARVRAQRVTFMDTQRGLVANVGTSMLVLAASPSGLPVSTTHLSTGALMGIRWAERLTPQQGGALRPILFAWCITLPAAAGFAAVAATSIRNLT